MDDEQQLYWGLSGLEQAAQDYGNRPKQHGGFANREQLEHVADWLTGLSGNYTDAEIAERIKASGVLPDEVAEAVELISFRAGRQRFLNSH
jgi:hypothetical protein